MVQLTIVCILVALNLASIDADLPKYITKCKRSDPKLNECLTVQSNIAIKNLLNGDPELKIGSLVPVEIPRLILGPSDDFRFEMTDIKGYGLATMKINDLKMDFEKHTIEIKMETEFGRWEGNYNVTGILNKKTYNHIGTANMTFDNVQLEYSSEYVPTDFDGKNYLQVKNDVTLLKTNKNVYTLSQSSNEKEAAELAKLLNEDKDFGREFLPFVKVLSSGVLSKIINPVLRSTPMDELFEP